MRGILWLVVGLEAVLRRIAWDWVDISYNSRHSERCRCNMVVELVLLTRRDGHQCSVSPLCALLGTTGMVDASVSDS